MSPTTPGRGHRHANPTRTADPAPQKTPKGRYGSYTPCSTQTISNFGISCIIPLPEPPALLLLILTPLGGSFFRPSIYRVLSGKHPPSGVPNLLLHPSMYFWYIAGVGCQASNRGCRCRQFSGFHACLAEDQIEPNNFLECVFPP